MTNKNIFLILASVFLLTIMFSLGSSQGVTQTVKGDKGIDISYPKYDTYFLKEDFNLTIHNYNISDGQKLYNSSCNLKLYNNFGDKLLDEDLNGQEEYYYNIPAGSLSNAETGNDLNFNIYCNNSGIGGFADGQIELSEKRNDDFALDLSDNINLILMFLLALIGVVLYMFTSYKTISSSMIIIAGFVLIFNGFQVFISGAIIGLGAVLGIIANEQ